MALPSGTGKLWIAGVNQEIIDEFNKMRKPTGSVKRRRKTWEVFEQIWNEWKNSQAKISELEKAVHYIEARKENQKPPQKDRRQGGGQDKAAGNDR